MVICEFVPRTEMPSDDFKSLKSNKMLMRTLHFNRLGRVLSRETTMINCRRNKVWISCGHEDVESASIYPMMVPHRLDSSHMCTETLEEARSPNCSDWFKRASASNWPGQHIQLSQQTYKSIPISIYSYRPNNVTACDRFIIISYKDCAGWRGGKKPTVYSERAIYNRSIKRSVLCCVFI